MSAASNRAKSSSGSLLIGIMLIVIVSQISQVSSSSPSNRQQQQQQQQQDFLIPTSNRVPSLAKRSLCNTFGGCGAKRSTPSLTYRRDFNNMMAGRLAPTGQSSELFGETSDGDRSSPSEGSFQLSKAKFVNEILDDLYEQLQLDERFKQVRVVAILPRASNSMESQLSFLAQKEDQQQPFSSGAVEQVQAIPMRRADYRM